MADADNDHQSAQPLPVNGSDPVSNLDGVTHDELAITIRVLNAVGKLQKQPDGLDLYKHVALRHLRKALASCFELQKRTMYQGKDETEFYQEERLKRSLKRQKTADKALQKKYIATTELRQGRIQKLQQLTHDGQEEEEEKVRIKSQYLIPDGHVETTLKQQPLLLTDQEQGEGDASTTKLPFHRSCYVCKIRYQDLHSFYDQLCPSCAALNFEKRHAVADCSRKVAVVTGARVKIGYQVCLKLLRSNCIVVATTRFPNAAVANFRREADFEKFRDKLLVYGLDLRDVTGLEAFTRYLKLRFATGIDILINNACQTVRRPAQYYKPLVLQEQSLWKDGDATHKAILSGCAEFERIRRKIDENQHDTTPALQNGDVNQTSKPMLLEAMDEEDDTQQRSSEALVAISSSSPVSHGQSPFETSGLSHSAAMSQTVLLPEDAGVSNDILPPGVTDINGHQIDLRTTNSWLLKMEEVSTPEVMECMFINCIAPFVLNSRLKPLMCTPHTEDRPDRYIINVSAMEGKFYRYKTPQHPHTNMAKAALNMMTRTSAEDLATKHRIFMNSVDTGWINDENPLEVAKKIEVTNLFQTPIDECDAAARILDPVFSGINERKRKYGCFFKDYHESEW
ncbi:hypothetical protein MPSEU_000659800 [Mayamaea pseudoterrestris]|nr:hypothetical protein MPSEU_000659800 [Mayamaea pseudoterrestris]